MIKALKAYFDYFITTPINSLIATLKLKHNWIINKSELGEIDYWEFNELFAEKKTSKWCKRAWKKHLELPNRDNPDYWDEKQFSHGKTLSNKGVRFILAQYREEKTAQRDVIIKWGTLILAAIAAFGTILKILG